MHGYGAQTHQTYSSPAQLTQTFQGYGVPPQNSYPATNSAPENTNYPSLYSPSAPPPDFSFANPNQNFNNPNLNTNQNQNYNSNLPSYPPSIPSYPSTVTPSYPPTEPAYPQIQTQTQNLPQNSSENVPVAIVQFNLTQAQAEVKFQEWVSSLYLLPTGFKKAVDAPEFKRYFVPFFTGSIAFMTTYEGMIERLQSDRITLEEHRVYDPYRNSHRDTISNMFYCADSTVQMREICEKMPHDWVVTQKTVTFNTLQVLKSTGDIVGASIPPEAMWNTYAEPRIRESELRMIQKNLAENRKTVKNLRISTMNYSGSTMRIVYLPIYFGTFKFNGNEYKFVVNGQNGTFYGDRPEYGLGKIGDFQKGIANFVGTITHTNQHETKILQGEHLNSVDVHYQVYKPDAFYIAFPRSDFLILKEATGCITLQNLSDYPIELKAQKRRGAYKRINPIFEMKARERCSFDFKGNWVIEIVRGNPSELKIESVITSGGNSGDKLGMCD